MSKEAKGKAPSQHSQQDQLKPKGTTEDLERRTPASINEPPGSFVPVLEEDSPFGKKGEPVAPVTDREGNLIDKRAKKGKNEENGDDEEDDEEEEEEGKRKATPKKKGK